MNGMMEKVEVGGWMGMVGKELYGEMTYTIKRRLPERKK